jgi:hypothetical protein
MNLYRDHWFWRDKSGHEVDLLWQHDEGLNLVEIKATTTISQDLLKGLYYLENIMPGGVKSKTLVYSGIENQERTTAAIRSWLWPDLSATS